MKVSLRRALMALITFVCSIGACAHEADSLSREVPIELNGADWSALAEMLQGDFATPFTIVHIGDSHLQADVPTSHLRRAFQSEYGDAGRGIVSPLKLSGTYQPSDYTITSPDKWTAAKFLRYPWNPPMGFTGTSLTPLSSEASITVTLLPDGDLKRTFDDIQLFHSGTLKVLGVTDDEGRDLNFDTDEEEGRWTGIALGEQTAKATIRFRKSGDFAFHTLNITNGEPGVVYHTIGNGGSDMQMYNLIGGFGEGVSMLYPDLIILALGTNDSYNHFTRERFAKTLNRLVSDLRENNPDAQLLLVTPMEIQYGKTATVKKKVKGKRGRKKTVSHRVKSLKVVDECDSIRRMMLDYGRDNNIAVYDWFEATGGKGASQRWVEAGLMRTDHIHLTAAGYRKHAEMLYKALMEALNR